MKLRKLTALSLTLLIILAMFPAAALERHSGADRYATAAEISENGWATANTVVLARGDNCVDAITGAPLAHYLQAPILLTTPGALSAASKTEIQRLGAKKAVILGGTSAISPAVEGTLKSMGLTVQRIGGKNRYDTAALIAKQAAPGGADTVFLANGDQPMEGLLAGPYAAALGAPILLTESSTLPEATNSALVSMGAKHVNVIGDIGSVGQGVMKKLPSPQRFYGSDLYGLATSLAASFATGATHFYTASGTSCIDILGAGALAAKNRTGILLVSSKVPQATRDFLVREYVYNLTIIGGYAAVSKPVEDELTSLLKTQSYVSPRRPVTGVTLDSTSLDMKTGDTRQLLAAISPANATNKKVTWESSDPAVATVSAAGLVSATGRGTATITVRTAEGDFTAAAAVDVTQPVTSITVTAAGNATEVYTGDTLQMSAAVLPANANNPDVTWTVAGGDAEIDANGLLSAGTIPGTITARATAADGSGVYGAKQILVKPVLVTGVTVNADFDTVIKGQTLQFSAQVAPANATTQTVTWFIINGSSYATLDNTGLLTGLAPGFVTVCAQAQDGTNIFGTKTVEVLPIPVGSITVNSETDSLLVNSQLQMKAAVRPKNAPDKRVRWTVSTGATITKFGGLLTAGPVPCIVTVRATARDGSGVYAEKQITIDPILVTKIKVTSAKNTVRAERTLQMAAEVLPGNATNKDVIWSVKGGNATIDADGLLYAGTRAVEVTVKAEAADGSGVVGTKKITVNPILVKQINITAPSDIVPAGESLQLNAEVLPVNATNPNIRWFISDGSECAAVDRNGLLTTTAPGVVTIHAAAKDESNVFGAITIYVVPVPVSGIIVHSNTDSVLVGGTLQMTAEVQPDNATCKNVIWSVTGDAVIDDNGILTAGPFPGTVTVIATAADGFGAYGEKQITIEPIRVASITVSSGADVLNTRSQMQMSTLVLPDDAMDKSVTWSVTGGNASIDRNGMLHSRTIPGDVTVRATANDGSGVFGEKVITVQGIALSMGSYDGRNVNVILTYVGFTLEGDPSSLVPVPTANPGGSLGNLRVWYTDADNVDGLEAVISGNTITLHLDRSGTGNSFFTLHVAHGDMPRASIRLQFDKSAPIKWIVVPS